MMLIYEIFFVGKVGGGGAGIGNTLPFFKKLKRKRRATGLANMQKLS